MSDTLKPFTLPDLPYAPDSLDPHISTETISYHYGKHHRGYVERLNELVRDTVFAEKPLEDVVRNAKGEVFQNAAQAWNHDFYWHSLSPGGAVEPKGALLRGIESQWGSLDSFSQEFENAALRHFGSGWVWLVQDANGSLSIQATANADSPLTQIGVRPLLTCDVWEHAYYIDHRNEKPRYLESWWACVNWDFAEQNLQ